jgi:hypothetical protein
VTAAAFVHGVDWTPGEPAARALIGSTVRTAIANVGGPLRAAISRAFHRTWFRGDVVVTEAHRGLLPSIDARATVARHRP